MQTKGVWHIKKTREEKRELEPRDKKMMIMHIALHPRNDKKKKRLCVQKGRRESTCWHQPLS